MSQLESSHADGGKTGRNVITLPYNLPPRFAASTALHTTGVWGVVL